MVKSRRADPFPWHANAFPTFAFLTVAATLIPSTDRAESTMFAVELWTARIPRWCRFAEHHWLLVYQEPQVSRWEVWQDPDMGGESWGHVHRNLLEPTSGVGNGPGRVLKRWTQEKAIALIERIESSPQVYPWRDRYRYWPGPNSNTFVQWVLGQQHQIGWRGFGKRYRKTRP